MPAARVRLRYRYAHRLRGAAREGEVVAIVREYWGEVPKWVKCLVPRQCHGRALVRAADVHWWSERLRDRFGAPSTLGDIAPLRDLVDFLDEASARLHEMGGALSSSASAATETRPPMHDARREAA